ncbi:MAG: hypothetical protein NC114_11630 [Ruminococcus flavefaciens]|nr:hypothetical protein [Ruminococcus flavefaciens]
MKYVDTPCGKAIMPAAFEEEIEKLTNDELIQQLIENEQKSAHGFIDPFKLQFVIDRGLYAEYLRARANQ